MHLDDRKWTILKAIIKTYLETGEPVGSRTISKYADLNLSSATIRNEMSDLEEMGYILQPHTSAGRIPSDAGYRLYVDRMMEEKDREVTEMKEMVLQRQDKMELLLKQMARILAANTNYAAMISGPQYHRTKLKFIQLSIISETQMLAVIVTEGNVVKNKMLQIEHGLDQQTVLEMNILLNRATGTSASAFSPMTPSAITSTARPVANPMVIHTSVLTDTGMHITIAGRIDSVTNMLKLK